MEIRKFIFSIVTKYDNKGMREADKDAIRLAKSADTVRKSFQLLAKAQLEAARDALALASAEGRAAVELDRLRKESDRSKRSIDKLEANITKLKAKLAGLQGFNLKSVSASFQGASEGLGKFQSALAPVGQIARAAATGIAVLTGAGVAVGTAVIKTGSEFESLRAQLKTVEGSAAGANLAFGMIQDFAKTTPFEIENLTAAFIALRRRGVRPTADTLTALGDLAAGSGRDIGELTDAISAASRGELDPLEKFISGAKVSGEQLQLTFGDTTVAVDRTAEAVTAALVEFGKMPGIQGAMADQSATSAGMISNLKDTFSQLFDQISQLGVLDEFKLLIQDVSNAAGQQGLAKVIADALIVGLRALRDLLSRITQEDVEGFFNSVIDVVTALASALKSAADAMVWFTEKSGGTEQALGNMALAVTALIALFAGPAGLVIAAGAAGAIVGRILADAVADLTGLNDEIEELETRNAERERKLREEEEKLERTFDNMERRKKAKEVADEERVKAVKSNVEAITGGLGPGLARTATEQELAGQFSERQAEKLGQDLLTREGKVVVEAVEREGNRRAKQAADKARREAKRAGASAEQVEEAAAAAQRSSRAQTASQRRKALETAEKTFAATGSAEEAAAAATAALETKEGKAAAKRRGGGGDEFFDFEKQAKTAAKTQAEAFAGQELERFRAEGIASEEAIRMAQEAGKERAKELEKRFLEAGRIFDASADNVLDILGLRGPGSVLEGRPPPQNLMIAPQITFKFIETFNQTIESVAGAQALEEITGRAGEAAAANGLTEWEARVRTLIDSQMQLQIQRLVKADAGGKLPPGVEG